MKTYLRKEARRHGSSLRITNKKIEQDMAQFFKDNTIQLFDKESVNMTQSKTEENKKPEAPAKRRGRPRKNS